jgi:hypothetical protein
MKRDFNSDPAGHRPKGLISGLDRCAECDGPISSEDTHCSNCGAETVEGPKMSQRFETKAGA